MKETQPLNEAYSNEVLEGFMDHRDIYMARNNLISNRVPYEEWHEEYKLPGIGCDPKGTKFSGFEKPPLPMNIPDFPPEMSSHSKKALKDLKECLEKGVYHVQSDCRPDESFRAMIEIFQKWIDCIESCEKKSRKKSKSVCF